MTKQKMLLLLHMFLHMVVVITGNRQSDKYTYQYDQPVDYDYADYDEDEGENKDSVESNVLSYRPTIVSQSKHIQVENGMTISLPCIVDKLPAGMQIIWTKVDLKNTIIAVGNSVSGNNYQGRTFITTTNKGSTLAIGAARASDAGQYKCSVALTDNRPEISHNVSIQDSKSNESSQNTVLEAKIGQTVNLNCQGFGSSNIDLKWTKEGSKMPIGDNFMVTDTLIFEPVTKGHAGTYKCSGRSKMGRTAFKYVEIKVLYPPEVNISVIHLMEKNQVELSCTVHAFPPPKIIWMKEGVEYKEEEVTKRGGGYGLLLTNIQKKHDGKYKCIGKNSEGETSQIFNSKDPIPNAGTHCNTFLLSTLSCIFCIVRVFRFSLN